MPFPSRRKSFSYLLLIDVNVKNSIFFHVEEVYWDDGDKGQAREGEEKKKREKGEKERREKEKKDKKEKREKEGRKRVSIFNVVCLFLIEEKACKKEML